MLFSTCEQSIRGRNSQGRAQTAPPTRVEKDRREDIRAHIYGNDVDDELGQTVPYNCYCHDCRRDCPGGVIAREAPYGGIICDRCGSSIVCDYCGHAFRDLDDLDTHEIEHRA